MRRISPALLLLTFAACSEEPPSPKDVRTSIHDDLRHVLTEGKAATDKSTANLPALSLFSLGSMTPNMTAMTSEVDVDAITNKLENEIFTDANYQGEGIFKLPASVLCKETIQDPDGTTTESLDPQCVTKVTKLQPRIRVASEDDAIRFYLQIDANHDEPLSLLLAHDKLAITVNLDDASDAMVAIAAVEGEPPPNADLKGQITASLTIVGPAHARVALSFDRALSIKYADQGVALDSADAYRFTSAAAKVIAVELDGAAASPLAKLDLGLGETTAHIPGAAPEPARDFVLGGATVSASYQGNVLSLDNISLGTKSTTYSVNGQVAERIDLNPNDGRKLSATVTSDPVSSAATIAVSPKLDLQMSVDHALLGDAAPVYDTTRVLLDGSLRSFEGSDLVEVVSGSFSITTNPAQYGFSATAGQCVTSSYATDPSTFQDYTAYSVGACQ